MRKFSVETARSKQVSAEIVLGLLELRKQVPGLLDGIGERIHVESGRVSPSGLSSDSPHAAAPAPASFVPRFATKKWSSYWPLRTDSGTAYQGAEIIDPLAATDKLPAQPDENLMAGVYYFRLARAAVGFWLDATKPLLLHNDVVTVDVSAVRDETVRRSTAARSAIDLIRRWDADVQVIRNQRSAVDQAAGLPIPGRDLRARAVAIAQAAGADPPSGNQVRRRLGSWHRGALRDPFGPISPTSRRPAFYLATAG